VIHKYENCLICTKSKKVKETVETGGTKEKPLKRRTRLGRIHFAGRC